MAIVTTLRVSADCLAARARSSGCTSRKVKCIYEAGLG